MTGGLKNGKQANGKSAAGRKDGRTGARRRPKPERQIPAWANIASGIASAILVIGLGFYVYWFFSHRVPEPDPHEVQPAMLKLRQMPSLQAGLTVDQYLNQEVERARKFGHVRSIQGWTARPVQGSASKIVIAFSYQETDQTEQRAEWLADLSHLTFTPQNDLAAAVYSQ